MDIGPVVGTPMGPMSVGWSDIVAWEEKTGFDLKPWEARLLRSLSSNYLAELRAAEDPLRPMPWMEMRQIVDRREEISRKVADVFGGLIAPAKGKMSRKGKR